MELLSQSDIIGIMDEATDLIHILTPDGTILYANQSWQRTLGLSPQHIIGQPIQNFIAPELRADFQIARESILNEKQTNAKVSTAFLSPGGKRVEVEGFISCHLKDGKVNHTHAILRDVTLAHEQERKISEAFALVSEREQNFNQLIRHAPDAIIVIDAESRIRLWNPKSESIFGWTAEEVSGAQLGNTIIPEQYRAMHTAGMKRLLTTGEAHVLNKTIEITALHRSGTEFHVALTISQTVVNGEILFIAFIRDISEQKALQHEVQLKQQQLQLSNQELSQYAYLASHDLKEPIRKILMFSDMMLRPQTKHAKYTPEELTRKIHGTAEKMAAIVTSIGQFSNISIVQDTGETPVAEILEEVMQDLQEDIRLKQTSIDYSALPVVKVNRTHLYQLFANLISNSLKYSAAERQREIMIRSVTNTNFCEITVSDNGIGFPNEFSEKIFEPFQRLHGKAFEGTGIGLSICRKIIELYGGTIRASSQMNQGATFTFSLPVSPGK